MKKVSLSKRYANFDEKFLNLLNDFLLANLFLVEFCNKTKNFSFSYSSATVILTIILSASYYIGSRIIAEHCINDHIKVNKTFLIEFYENIYQLLFYNYFILFYNCSC